MTGEKDKQGKNEEETARYQNFYCLNVETRGARAWTSLYSKLPRPAPFSCFLHRERPRGYGVPGRRFGLEQRERESKRFFSRDIVRATTLPPICYCNLHHYGWDTDNGIPGFTRQPELLEEKKKKKRKERETKREIGECEREADKKKKTRGRLSLFLSAFRNRHVRRSPVNQTPRWKR